MLWEAKRCCQGGLEGRTLCVEQARGRVLRLGQTWKVTAWEIAQLGSCYLGKYPGKVAAWGKAFGKVPNIFQMVVLVSGVLLEELPSSTSILFQAYPGIKTQANR